MATRRSVVFSHDPLHLSKPDLGPEALLGERKSFNTGGRGARDDLVMFCPRSPPSMSPTASPVMHPKAQCT